MRTCLLLSTALVLSARANEPLKVDGSDTASVGDDGTEGTVDADPDADGDGVVASEDCNDADASVFPGAEETCNGVDDDCDNETDEGVRETFYYDNDGDGFGNPLLSVEACTAPSGSVADGTDCDDTNTEIFPGAVDVCNEIDDDCDDEIDEDGDETIYADMDGDGWGDNDSPGTGCPSSGWALEGGDCDDDDPQVSPGQSTDYCDGQDTDCDGDIDEDSKAGWSLLTIETRIGSVLDIDTTSGAITTTTFSYFGHECLQVNIRHGTAAGYLLFGFVQLRFQLRNLSAQHSDLPLFIQNLIGLGLVFDRLTHLSKLERRYRLFPRPTGGGDGTNDTCESITT